MKKEKEFLREKMIAFQMKAAELSHDMREREEEFRQGEKSWIMGVVEVLDILEVADENARQKEADLDKAGRKLRKSMGTVEKKLRRLLKRHGVVKMEFPDNRAAMESCKIVDTEPREELEDETILTQVRSGYRHKDGGEVVRKAEVITVKNG